MTPTEAAWARLSEPWHIAFDEAWESFRSGSAGVGAVVTNEDEVVVATGRSRVFDEPDGTAPLAGTWMAHAEMNALALLGRDDKTVGEVHPAGGGRQRASCSMPQALPRAAGRSWPYTTQKTVGRSSATEPLFHACRRALRVGSRPTWRIWIRDSQPASLSRFSRAPSSGNRVGALAVDNVVIGRVTAGGFRQ